MLRYAMPKHSTYACPNIISSIFFTFCLVQLIDLFIYNHATMKLV